MTSTKVWRFSETSMDEFIDATCMGKTAPTATHENTPRISLCGVFS